MSRDESLVRAAELRAAILYILNSNTAGVSFREIFTHKKVSEMKAPEATVRGCVGQLVKTSQINAVKDGRSVTFYPITAKVEAIEQMPAVVKRKPDVKVDIVKSTGKVRIEINGLLLEIGVV
jgi:Fe2+ or Zn2+ uptake regulation protein